MLQVEVGENRLPVICTHQQVSFSSYFRPSWPGTATCRWTCPTDSRILFWMTACLWIQDPRGTGHPCMSLLLPLSPAPAVLALPGLEVTLISPRHSRKFTQTSVRNTDIWSSQLLAKGNERAFTSIKMELRVQISWRLPGLTLPEKSSFMVSLWDSSPSSWRLRNLLPVILSDYSLFCSAPKVASKTMCQSLYKVAWKEAMNAPQITLILPKSFLS